MNTLAPGDIILYVPRLKVVYGIVTGRKPISDRYTTYWTNGNITGEYIVKDHRIDIVTSVFREVFQGEKNE